MQGCQRPAPVHTGAPLCVPTELQPLKGAVPFSRLLTHLQNLLVRRKCSLPCLFCFGGNLVWGFVLVCSGLG